MSCPSGADGYAGAQAAAPASAPRRRSGPPGWWPIPAVALLALGLLIAIQHRNVPPVKALPAPPAVSTSASRTTATTTPDPSTTEPAGSTVTVTSPPPTWAYVRNAGQLLGITAGYELFGWGPKGVVRVEFARGRINVTPGRDILSSGPVSLLVDPDHAVIRPLDSVAGFKLRDDGDITALTGALARSGPALPGPTPDQAWVPSKDESAMVLVDLDGRPTGASVPIPTRTSSVQALADGAGGVLFTDSTGIQLGGRSGHLPGTLLADGPTGYLLRRCDNQKCTTEFVDRGTLRAREVTGSLEPAGTAGVISGDGRFAALATGAGITLVDLISGRVSNPALPAGRPDPTDSAQSTGAGNQMLAWSPDSHYVFLVGDSGTLFAVDAVAGQAQVVNDALPPLATIVVRAASPVA